jgi:outer membrane protein
MRSRMRVPYALLLAALLVPGATSTAQQPAAPPPEQQVAPSPAQPTAPPPTPQAAPAPDQQPATTDRPALQLSLEEAVKRALDNNVDIAVERYNPELSAQSVRGAEGYYDPFLFSTLNHLSSDTPGTSAISGGTVVNSKQDVWNFGASVPIPTGADFTVTFNNNKRDSNSSITSFNPLYNSSLGLNLTQPLLKNFLIDQPRTQIKISKKNREISDVQFRQTVINTLATVKNAYWELIYAIDNQSAAQKSLDLARKLLQENEIRVKVGTMAPLDVVSAQSEVAGREQGLIVAENALANAEDQLKRYIFPEDDPVMWSTRIVPTDRPSAEPMPVDMEAAVKNALENRTDMIAARKSLEKDDMTLRLARNQLLPQVDLTAGYGTAGAGGTELIRQPPFGGPVVSTIPGGYSDALSQVFGRDFPTWSIGLQLSYAIPNRSQKASAAAAQISKDQALAAYRRLALQVAQEVRTAARGVESGFRSVTAATASRVLFEQRLDAEEKKFQAGMSTNFLVTQAQRDVATAEVTELRAIADYRESIINFQRVQEAGVSGFGAVTVVSQSSGGAQAAQAVNSAAAASSF